MSSEKTGEQGFGEKVQNNWGILLVIWTVAAVGVTWTVAEKVIVGPKETRIAELQKQLDQEKSKPVISPIPKVAENPQVLHDAVAEHTSVTTPDGVCQVLVDSIIGESTRLVITVGSQVVTADNVHPGQRVRAGAYYVDLHRIRVNVVDLSIYKQNF
jgi:hypothetical protein